MNPHISVCMAKPIFIKSNTYEYIMATNPISTAYFINPSHQSVCLFLLPPIVARQQIGVNVTAATNTYENIEELLDASFSMWPLSYQRKYTINSFQNFLLLNVALFRNEKYWVCLRTKFGLESPEYCRGIRYADHMAPLSASGGRLVGILRLRTQASEFSFSFKNKILKELLLYNKEERK
jgi:hypothetical protein